MLHLTYKHPRTRKRVEIRQAVRIARQQPFELNVGARASVVCWGVMPSGMLRHPLFLGWTYSTHSSRSGVLESNPTYEDIYWHTSPNACRCD
jgi:hypothetical protein